MHFSRKQKRGLKPMRSNKKGFCLFLPSQALATSAETYPMFTFAEGKSQDEEESDASTNDVTHIERKQDQRKVNANNSMEEFVLL